MSETEFMPLRKRLREATSMGELKSLGAEFSTPYADTLVYKHPSLPGEIWFYYENEDGTLEYNDTLRSKGS